MSLMGQPKASFKGQSICAREEMATLNSYFKSHGVPALYMDAWFSTYKTTTKDQEAAFETIKEGFNKSKPMVFLGTYGGGKTHLATAMVKHKLYYRYDAWYYTLSELFRDYRSSFQNDPEMNERKFFKRIKTTDLLVIDEINIRSDSEAENRFIQEIVDVRYSEQLQTIFIANMSLDEFSELMGERLVDRLKGQDAEIITFNWDSHRGK